MAKLQPKPKLTVVKPPPQESGTSKVQAKSTTAIDGFRSSDEILADRLMFTVHSQPGMGKSFFAGTLSKFWPKELPTKKRTSLDDMVWMACDEGATNGLKEQGVNVPYVVDLNWLMRPPTKKDPDKPYASTILDALPLMIEIAYKRVEQGETDIIVVDTVSSIDRKLNTYWEEHVPTTKGGKEDRFAMYRMVMKYHSQFYEAMSLFPCTVIFLAHTKAIIEGDDDNAKAKHKAASLAGDNDLAPSITGKSLETYTANVSVEFALQAVRAPGWKPGDPAEFSRYVLPIGGNGFRGKNRFQLSLETKEPAHLGRLVEKIRNS